MPDFGIFAGDTSKTVYVRLRDSTTGLAKTGLAWNSAGANAYYTLPQANAVSITLATLGTPASAWSSGGFVEVDATNAKGLYRLDLPDAAIASGAFTIISLEFDGTVEESMMIPLFPRAQSVLDVETYAQPGQEAPPATTSLAVMIRYLYKAFRNKKEQTASEFRLYDDAGTTVDQKCAVSDSGTVATKEELATGP